DGSIAPNKRIGYFLGQLGSPNANAATDYAFLTEAGRTLFLNTVAFALGTGPASAPLELSAAKVGGKIQITWTDSAAKLESAGTVTGPWSPVPNATSPYQQDSSAALRQFFRLSKLE